MRRVNRTVRPGGIVWAGLLVASILTACSGDEGSTGGTETTTPSTTQSTAPEESQGPEQSELTFSLDVSPFGRHTAFYVALDNGYFEEVGLDVTIEPGEGSAGVAQRLVAGAIDLGFVDISALAIQRSQGATVKQVAAIYNKTPYAFFSLKETGIEEPADLEGKTLGEPPGAIIPSLLPIFGELNGFDASKVEVVSAEFTELGPLLIQGEVDATGLLTVSECFLDGAAKASGSEGVSAMKMSDFGLQLASNGIATTEEFLTENPQTVRLFVEAVLLGYQFTFRNPEEAADIMVARFPELDRDATLCEVEAIRDLVVTEEVETEGLGHISNDRLNETVGTVIEALELSGVSAEDLFTSEFLPAEPVLP